jgi:hypothetical protein
MRNWEFDNRKYGGFSVSHEFFKDTVNDYSAILISLMMSDLIFGLKVFTQKVTAKKMGNLNCRYLYFLINQKLQGVEKRALFNEFKKERLLKRSLCLQILF